MEAATHTGWAGSRGDRRIPWELRTEGCTLTGESRRDPKGRAFYPEAGAVPGHRQAGVLPAEGHMQEGLEMGRDSGGEQGRRVWAALIWVVTADRAASLLPSERNPICSGGGGWGPAPCISAQEAAGCVPEGCPGGMSQSVSQPHFLKSPLLLECCPRGSRAFL